MRKIRLRRVRNLRELRLDGNQLSRLPDCVPELRGLEVLDLRGNSIEALPTELKFLRSLLDLDLEGNPIGPQVMRMQNFWVCTVVVISVFFSRYTYGLLFLRFRKVVVARV